MGCCSLVLLLVVGPRLVLFLMWLFTSYLVPAYDHAILLPLLGFFFLPWTTLAYAWAVASGYGLHGIGLIVVILAVVIDLTTHGGSGRAYRSRYS
jgi:hypothetical protein